MTEQEWEEVTEAVDAWAAAHPTPDLPILQAGRTILSPRAFARALHARYREDTAPYKVIKAAAEKSSVRAVVKSFAKARV